jgi:hypothetical protein
MTKPVPEPALPLNSATIRPLVGQLHFGGGSDGGGTLRFCGVDVLTGALATVSPWGGVSRIVWPG